MAGDDVVPSKRVPVCRWLFAAFLLALSTFRASLRCRHHAHPPDVRVEVGSENWEARLRSTMAAHGYVHVPALLNRSEVQALRAIAHGYCYGEPRRALPLSYGGYSVPGFLDLPEFAGARWLPEDPRVQTLLRATFNGTAFRFASHNDVGCDFVGVWHKDVLRGKVAKFQECDVWSSDTDGESHDIYKLMFYLQDHEQDEQALKVIPGSHVLRTTPWDDGYVALHPRMGDAVIFDQRLSHAGNTFYDVFGQGRLFMQVGFGRANRFTDEFERGTRERQQDLQRRMLSKTTPQGFASALADAKFVVIGTLLTALPPQLLNYFADADVKHHAERSCSSQQAAGAGARPAHTDL